MTIEQIKEQLSNNFIGILAANKGFTLDKPSSDFGVDYQLKKAVPYINPKGETRYLTDGNYLDIQLKSTTEDNITYTTNSIKYVLEAKNYNDLIERKSNGFAPLILILFILPTDVATWVNMDASEIKLRRNAFWYYPPDGAVQTENGRTITIEIDKSNLLDADCFNNLHLKFYP